MQILVRLLYYSRKYYIFAGVALSQSHIRICILERNGTAKGARAVLRSFQNKQARDSLPNFKASVTCKVILTESVLVGALCIAWTFKAVTGAGKPASQLRHDNLILSAITNMLLVRMMVACGL